MLFYFCAAISDMMEYFRRTLHFQGILADKQQRPMPRPPIAAMTNCHHLDLVIGAIGGVTAQAFSRQFCHQTTANVLFVN